MFTGTHDKLVDKFLFITMLMQLKAAALAKVLQNYLLSLIILHILPVNNMNTSSMLTVAH